jgi:hypothetical protein
LSFIAIAPGGWLCLSALVLAIIGFPLAPFAVDFPDRRRFAAKPFRRIIDRAERKLAQALAKLSKRNAGPGELILLADDVGRIAHSAFAFLGRTPATMPQVFSTT